VIFATAWGAGPEMNMDSIIHIGYQKTGSKALQRMLAQEPGRVAPGTFCYPAAGREALWHKPVRDALVAGDDAPLRAAVDEAARSGAAHAVLSFEGFCTMPAPAVHAMRAVAGPARIVMFLRRQDDLVNSMLNQLVMAHRTNHEWIEEYEETVADYDPLLDYRALLSTWADAFGEDALVPLLYDKGEDVGVRFGRALGIDVAPPAADAPNPNPALDAESYRALRELKRGATDEALPALVDEAHARLRGNFVDTFRAPGIALLDAPTRAAILANYRESNAWVRARWFPQRATLFEGEVPA
jgi:hypothetical protein